MSPDSTPLFTPEQLGLQLPDCGPDGLDPKDHAAVMERIGSFQVDWSALGPHVMFSTDGYVRRRLMVTEDWGVLLLCWLPGQRTPIHDHGASCGFALGLMGQLTESLYRWNGEGRPMDSLVDRPMGSDGIAIERSDTIHMVSNRGVVPALSLHMYSPPLAVFDTFDADTGLRSPVELEDSLAAMAPPLPDRSLET